MRTYASKEEWIAEVKQRYQKFITDFETISEAVKNKRIAEVDKTP